MTCKGCPPEPYKPLTNAVEVKRSKGITLDTNFIRDVIIQKLLSLENQTDKVNISNSIRQLMRPCCWQDINMVANSVHISIEIV